MDAKSATRRWFLPTPAWLVYGAAVAAGILFACERWRWFPVHYQKGWPVLLAVAVVASVLVLILAWMLAALVFRRRVQFGLGTLLVFVTLCAVVCSWLAVRIKEATQQAETLSVMEKKYPGGVFHDWEIGENGSILSGALPPESDPLMKLLGADFFNDAGGLSLGGPELTDAALADVRALTRLRMVWLSSRKVTDAWLPQFEGLDNLRAIYLVNTNVTDEGVKKLRRAMPQCRIQFGEIQLPLK